MSNSCYEKFGKRLFDLIIVLFLSPFVIFLCGVTSILILLFIGKPVFFRQKRIGFDEKSFEILKFRTMKTPSLIGGLSETDFHRQTKFGNFLRRYSIDELPEIWNVLNGDMSLVGPRPLFDYYLPYYKKEERIRHTVLPGITGYAQVLGRNNLNWDDRLQLDIEYVKRISFLFDCRILIKTVGNVLIHKDVLVIPGLTMSKLSEYRRNMF